MYHSLTSTKDLAIEKDDIKFKMINTLGKVFSLHPSLHNSLHLSDSKIALGQVGY